MRPVNLLPQSARPYVASGKAGKGSYVLIGVLAALVLMIAGYVLTTNKITSHKDAIAQAQQETAAAQAKSASLEKYGQFNQVAAARVSAVGTLAVNRIDYERLLRETARVLPGGVWLTTLDAEATGGSSGSSSPSSTSTTSSTTSTTPAVHLIGCAPNQRSVAATLVRLRAIHGQDDVQLNDSGKALTFGTGGSSSGASSTCGSHYAFDILVNLNNQVTGFGDMGHKVPASLGGGS